jgi:peptidyl-prolyl cis-trans isomerase D
MGSVFNNGNTNNIAKINNKNISTQDFMDYLNSSGLSQKVIKENLDKNILEELLSTLVSATLLDLEIKDMNLTMSEDILITKIKNNKEFQDENGEFQRTLYEKFLLINNITAPRYEMKLKSNVLQKQLFTYISGGAKSSEFLVNKYYKDNNSKLDIDYINLKIFYKKKDEFSDQSIKRFIEENSEKLKQEYIDFSYVIIDPKNLTGSDEFNQEFFDKIDDIENKISKNIDFRSIVSELNIAPNVIKDYINMLNEDTIENKIYNSRNDKIEILEDKGTYIFYNIDKVNNKLPSLSDNKYKSQIKNLLFQKEKYEYNTKILKQINEGSFNQSSFDKLTNNNVSKIKLESIKDDSTFEINSVELLYSLPKGTFTLVSDYNDDIFLAKTVRYKEQSISQDSTNFKAVLNEASAKNRNTILKSYDFLLNDKYKVVVNEKTLERVKNYFK